MKKAAAISVAVVVLLLGIASRGQAQGAGTGSIGGTLRDPKGLVVPGAAVIVRNVDTGAERTLAEFSSESLWQYLLSADYLSPQSSKALAAQIGSEPFGEGLKKWIVASPGFNTDKIVVPILFESNYPVSLIYYWDIYAALRLQRKPVELLYIRNGDHVLTAPQERLTSQEMNVDWYDFWLNGHEDPDPAKADQYKRWRELRKMQQQNEKNSPAPSPN